MSPSAPKSEPLRVLFWRSEILRVVYWLYGEGLGDLVDIELIRQYLEADPKDNLTHYVDLLVQDGTLVRDGEWFALSPRALTAGEAELATAFTDLIRPVSNECDDECWCNTSAAEAAACAQARSRLLPARANEAGKAPA